MIVVHAVLTIDPDRREEAIDVIERLVARTREERGVLDYSATVDLDDRNVIRFFERYESEAALEAHLESDHYERFVDRLPELLAEHPEAVRFDVAEMEQLEG